MSDRKRVKTCGSFNHMKSIFDDSAFENMQFFTEMYTEGYQDCLISQIIILCNKYSFLFTNIKIHVTI